MGQSPTLDSFVTALYRMLTRSSDENSVRLSVKRMHCDKTKERSVHILQRTKDQLAQGL